MAGWNPDPQGVYPAATGVQFHGGDIPAPQHSPDFGYIQEAIKSVGDYLQQKKSDDIANQILAADTGGATTGATTGDYGGETSGAAPQKSLFDQLAGTSGTPDLGGVEALKMHLLMQHSNAQAAQEQAMANYYNAGGAHRGSSALGSGGGVGGAPPTWTDNDGNIWSLNGNGTLGHKISSAAGPAVGLSPLDQRREQLVQETARRTGLSTAKEALANAVGLPPEQLPGVAQALENYVPGQSAFPKIGTHEAINDATEGPYKDRILSAYQAYKNALRPAAPAAQPDAAPAIPQGAIDKLRTNPQLAGDFDAKYGEGSSQLYLGR